MAKFIIVVLAVIGLFVTALAMEGFNFLALLGPSAFIMAVLVPLLLPVAVWRCSQLLRVWHDAFCGADGSTSRTSERILSFTEAVFYLCGGLCLIMGLIVILGGGPGETSLETLGEKLALGLVGPVWALTGGIAMRVLRARAGRLLEG
jgi:hypothetical protein